MTETYVVNSRTERSSISVATESPQDALKRASEMAQTGAKITITDRDGNRHTLAELEANILSGKYAKPHSARF